MDFKSLLYFITVVDELSFTKASHKLHVSQPALSAMIKKLEKTVNLVLIDRTQSQIRLTKAGEILYKEAKNLLVHYHDVNKEIAKLAVKGPLDLSIGVIESTYAWIPNILKTFDALEPSTYVKLLDILGLHMVQTALDNFDIHIAITNQFIRSEHVTMVPLYKERLVTIIPTGHPLQKKSTVTINDLHNEKFIIAIEGLQTREDILIAFDKAGINPTIKYEIGRLETACRLVGEGLGISIVPMNYVVRQHNNFIVKEIIDPIITRTVYLAYMNNRYLPPIVHTFLNLVIAYHQPNTNL